MFEDIFIRMSHMHHYTTKQIDLQYVQYISIREPKEP